MKRLKLKYMHRAATTMPLHSVSGFGHLIRSCLDPPVILGVETPLDLQRRRTGRSSTGMPPNTKLLCPSLLLVSSVIREPQVT